MCCYGLLRCIVAVVVINVLVTWIYLLLLLLFLLLRFSCSFSNSPFILYGCIVFVAGWLVCWLSSCFAVFIWLLLLFVARLGRDWYYWHGAKLSICIAVIVGAVLLIVAVVVGVVLLNSRSSSWIHFRVYWLFGNFFQFCFIYFFLTVQLFFSLYILQCF